MKTINFELKDICKIKSGKRLPAGTDFSDQITEYKYIRARDIKAGKINYSELVYIDENIHKKLSKYIVNTNDIVITIVGASVGDVAYVTEEFDGMNLTENAVRLTEFEDYVNSKYLMYVLNTKKYWELMQQIAGGSAQPKLGIYKIETIAVELPERKIQDTIMGILSAYDDLIENNQKQIKLLEEAAQRLYKEWFVDLRFPGHEDVPVVDGVPQGWKKVYVTDLLEIKYGKDHKSLTAGNIPVYGSGGIMRTVDKIIHSGESVLIPRKGSLNNIFYVTGDFWTIDTMFYSLPLRENIMKYMYIFLSGLDMYSFNIGAAVPSMTVKILESIQLKLPTPDLLEQFEKMTRPLFERQKTLNNQCETAKQARDCLLPKLMSGELEV